MLNECSEEFLEESFELCERIKESIPQLEEDEHDDEAISEIFHSLNILKGNACFEGIPGVYKLFHDIYEYVRPYFKHEKPIGESLKEKLPSILHSIKDSIEEYHDGHALNKNEAIERLTRLGIID